MRRSRSNHETSAATHSDVLKPALTAELRRLQLRTRRNLNADMMGNYRTAFRGSGLIYSDLRQYQPGDEVKSIHWKASARTGEVFVKSYEEDRQLRIILCLDISRSTLFGADKSKHTRILEFAALIALLAQNNQDALGLCLFASTIVEYLPARRSPTQFQQVLSQLLKQRELPRATNIAVALEHVERYQRKPSIVFVVSDFISPPYEEALQRLSFRHDVICCLVEDQWDAALPRIGIVEFEDPETGRRTLFDTSSKRAQEFMRLQSERRKSKLTEQAVRCGADVLCLQDRPLAALNALMRKRSKRISR